MSPGRYKLPEKVSNLARAWFLTILLLLSSFPGFGQSQTASLTGVASGPDLSPHEPPLTDPWGPLIIPDPATGTGLVHVTVETLQERTPRMYSRRAEHVEIWWRDRRLASMYKGDEGVQESFHRRVFVFPPLELPLGYHFIQIRLYGEGWLSRNKKWKGETLQIGIHPDRSTRLHRIMPFHLW